VSTALAISSRYRPADNVVHIADWVSSTIERIMGYGDEIIATGMARGAAVRGKRIAFGNGRRIVWSDNCEPIFRHNPNIAPPGFELQHHNIDKIEWIQHYKHHRAYMSPSEGGRWRYNRGFKIKPGELYFSQEEKEFAARVPAGFVLIEPRVKPVYPNKQWAVGRYIEVAQRLGKRYPICQFAYGGLQPLLPGVRTIPTPTIRHALAVLARAALFIGCEGAMTHGAAAVGVNAVVLFGGFTDPLVLGYAHNVNLTGGAEPCGTTPSCAHCREAMNAITVDDVCAGADQLLAEVCTR